MLDLFGGRKALHRLRLHLTLCETFAKQASEQVGSQDVTADKCRVLENLHLKIQEITMLNLHVIIIICGLQYLICKNALILSLELGA